MLKQKWNFVVSYVEALGGKPARMFINGITFRRKPWKFLRLQLAGVSCLKKFDVSIICRDYPGRPAVNIRRDFHRSLVIKSFQLPRLSERCLVTAVIASVPTRIAAGASHRRERSTSVIGDSIRLESFLPFPGAMRLHGNDFSLIIRNLIFSRL